VVKRTPDGSEACATQPGAVLGFQTGVNVSRLFNQDWQRLSQAGYALKSEQVDDGIGVSCIERFDWTY
jgi:hypothetical protein